MAYPVQPEQQLHCVLIPPSCAKVDLDHIARACHNLELDILGEAGKKTLADDLNGFVAWQKRYIKFGNEDSDEDNDPNVALSSDKDPPLPRTSLQRSPTEIYEVQRCRRLINEQQPRRIQPLGRVNLFRSRRKQKKAKHCYALVRNYIPLSDLKVPFEEYKVNYAFS
jgi:hypothetical protein